MNFGSFLTPLPRLYFFAQTGCGHCEEARPIVARLKQEHALRILVVELRLDRKEWNILGWTPSATPGFALVNDGKLSKKHVGLMEYDELAAWCGLAPEKEDTSISDDGSDDEDEEEDPEDEEALA